MIGKWSEISLINRPDIRLCSWLLLKILSMRAAVSEAIPVGSVIKSQKQARVYIPSKNLLVAVLFWLFNKFTH